MSTLTLARRSFLARIATLPLVGAGASLFARRTESATATVIDQIDRAERRCKETLAAFDKALVAYDAAVPEPHFTLLERDRWDITLEKERRRFDGEFIKRGVDRRGEPCSRSIATVNTLIYDLNMDRQEVAGRSKALRRLRRRAAKHEERMRAMEKSFDLWPLHRAKDSARREMEALARAIFERPATTLPEILVQAYMLCAFSRVVGEPHAAFWAARHGATIAENLNKLGRVA